MRIDNHVLARLLLVCALSGAAFGVRPLLAAEQRVALVIGNSVYPAAPLRNPGNDATAMAAMLRTMGFDVMLRTNATQREMSRAISEFGKRLTLGGTAVFYFAGHGVQVRGKNFLIPVDAEIETEGAVRGEAVDVDHVLDQLGPAQVSMVILDACRNNPFEARFRRVGGGGLAQIDAPKGTLVAYATAPGEVAADGTGSNGLYTAALLKAMDVPGRRVEDVFLQARIEVIRESGRQQTPWESSSLTADFRFRPDGKTIAADARLRRAEEARLELQHEMEKLRAELIKIGALVEKTSTTLAPAGEEWATRIAILEKSRGQLNLSASLAILLNVSNPEELTLLVSFEKDISRSGWASAFAMGLDRAGKTLWANAVRYKNRLFARETALEFCAKGAESPCVVVLENGTFKDKEFLELAHRFSEFDADTVRSANLQSLITPPTETQTPGAAGAMGTNVGGQPWAARVSMSARE